MKKPSRFVVKQILPRASNKKNRGVSPFDALGGAAGLATASALGFPITEAFAGRFGGGSGCPPKREGRRKPPAAWRKRSAFRGLAVMLTLGC